MAWCEQHRVDYVFGLARNKRLEAKIGPELAQAKAAAQASGQPARCLKDFLWSTRDSWSRRRRVIAKAEWSDRNLDYRGARLARPMRASYMSDKSLTLSGRSS